MDWKKVTACSNVKRADFALKAANRLFRQQSFRLKVCRARKIPSNTRGVLKALKRVECAAKKLRSAERKREKVESQSF